jgi:hypothetical protein
MLIPVLAVGAWVLAVAVALRCLHECEVHHQPINVLPDVPTWVWTQDRVDAEFRALTAPLTR